MKKSLSLLFCGLATSGAYAQSASCPNLVLFIADDCTYSDIACYGSENALTPRIDGFARQGMMFTQAYQAAPMSSPTRHNLYTGIWPVKSGAYPNHTMAKPEVKSIVHHLHPLGYKVALVGKSHINPKSVFPFDLYVPALPGKDLDFEAIRSFIDECTKSNTPYCLLVASNQPHTPWNKGDVSLFPPRQLKLPPIYLDIPETREEYSKYLAEVNYMDGEFGTLLDILDKKQQTQNTVVVFLSEQGNSFPFAKWTCYDKGVHSACIVRWPDVIRANSVSDALVEYVDILPTFIDLAGGTPVCELDGESFKEVLLGKTDKHKKYTFSLQTTRGINQGSDYYGVRSVYDGQYRYILNFTPEVEFDCAATSTPLYKAWEAQAPQNAKARELVDRYQHRPGIELYDVKKDPYCLKNLASDKKYEAKLLELDKALKQWMEECGDQGQQTELDALTRMPKHNKPKK